VTATTIPGSGTRSLPIAGSGVDRAIRASTAAVVLAVAGIAAYISYWHAYAVVREWGESGITALLEPATIDGLVYASSMVILHAARHRLPVPRLARWMLVLGIAASLAVNVAQGWSHGLAGAVVAAWPAVSLVGSYELLAWLIRTAAPAGPDRVPAADHDRPQADQPGTSLPAGTCQERASGPEDGQGDHVSPVPAVSGSPLPVVRMPADQAPGPVRTGPVHASQADQAGGQDRTTDLADKPDHDTAIVVPGRTASPAGDVNAAAVTAYLHSLQAGNPLSERKLAEMFGLTSRRWARNRMAEARQSPAAA
jgi:hypothetical protein